MVDLLHDAHASLLGAAYDRSIFLEAANDIATLKARIQELEGALGNIIAFDRKESFRTIECDPAGNTMEVIEIDGPCALLARAALEAKPAGGTEA